MKIENTPFEGLLILTPQVFTDERGYFFEPFNEARFRVETGLNITFVQDNESLSMKGTLRGMHFQLSPKSQAKLIRVSRGAVLDVVVDLRRTQPTFGKYFMMELNAADKKQLFVPEGFAHGFYALEDHTVFTYKCSNYYHKELDAVLAWNDPKVNIPWPSDLVLLSEKDKQGRSLDNCTDLFF
jgi:dTDP-4-dehydrorhamnose 3,5-epimerase